MTPEMNAKELLIIMKSRTRMYAQTKEALLAQVCGILSVIMYDDFSPIDFYQDHMINCSRGTIMRGLLEDFDDTWGRNVCENALIRLNTYLNEKKELAKSGITYAKFSNTTAVSTLNDVQTFSAQKVHVCEGIRLNPRS